MDNQNRFLELVTEYERLKGEMKKFREEMDQVMRSLDYGTYVQDPATLIVYKIVEPKGTFIEYKTIDYVRTAKPTERQGSLSKKEAEEAGFVLLSK